MHLTLIGWVGVRSSLVCAARMWITLEENIGLEIKAGGVITGPLS
jgi:hypothetical protein